MSSQLAQEGLPHHVHQGRPHLGPPVESQPWPHGPGCLPSHTAAAGLTSTSPAGDWSLLSSSGPRSLHTSPLYQTQWLSIHTPPKFSPLNSLVPIIMFLWDHQHF